jgi:hypothetical protein
VGVDGSKRPAVDTEELIVVRPPAASRGFAQRSV